MSNPLVADPLKAIGFDYMWGELSLTLSHPVNLSWVSTFKNMGKFRIRLDTTGHGFPYQEIEL